MIELVVDGMRVHMSTLMIQMSLKYGESKNELMLVLYILQFRKTAYRWTNLTVCFSAYLEYIFYRNIVFIQYNRDTSGLQLLPAKHIDTGMGLERLVSILQDKSSNYDIDVFQPLFQKMSEHTTLGDYTGRVGADDADLKDTAYRAIADHARTLAFAIADGAVPSNEGRGYVLRRILRRATRYGQQILGAKPGFFASLVPVVVNIFGEFYPELKAAERTITEIIQEEELAFSSMLERGIKFFDELKDEMEEAGEKQIDGSKAFYLYDTLGFPIDLTELMAQEAGMTVDLQVFAEEMEQQKERSRQAQKAARSAGAPELELIAEQTAWLADQNIAVTDDSYKYKLDVHLPATVMAIFGEDGFYRYAEEGDFVGLVLDKTPFYAEGGGQEPDLGTIELWDEKREKKGLFKVTDVQVYAGYVLHKGLVEAGSVETEQSVDCKVDYNRRRKIAPNHSMTHVLNAALRHVLGSDCDQRGSLCNEEKLRFDFSYKQALTATQLKQVEEFCQNIVAKEHAVTSEVMPLDKAQQIEGVRAVFGEVYPDPVRVVQIGGDTSVEFCGGTHIENTAEAEAFVLVEETAVSKGIRRITAVTKTAAKQALEKGAEFQSLLEQAEKLDVTTSGLDKQAGALRKDLDAAFMSASIKSELRARIDEIQKKAVEAKKKVQQKRVDSVLINVTKDIETANNAGKQVLVLNVDIAADSKASQRVLNTAKEIAPDMAVMGLSEEEPGSGGKILAFALVPDSLIESGLKADEWIRAALEPVNGRGGGKPANAQGQAQQCVDVSQVVDAATAFALQKVPTRV
jgi:alanyl-tRNA synthetase